ncbi:MAG: glycoside hydrolase 15-related [Rhizobacter sp.]|nr:glycoside hydrolase 15-related [Rhizobacter sp.]
MMPAQPPAGPSRTSRSNERPIGDYALIGDMRGCALVAIDASIDWLCFERFDNTPVFVGLLDAGAGGSCSIDIGAASEQGSRRYLPDTNILQTTLVGDSGRLVVTDFMAVRIKPGVQDTGEDSEASHALVRCLACVTGAVEFVLRIEPGFDWGRKPGEPELQGLTAFYPDDGLHVAVSAHAAGAAPRIARDGNAVVLRMRLAAGDSVGVVLGPTAQAVGLVPDVERLFDETHHYWLAWQSRSTYRGPYADKTARSGLCLKLLTYAPTGGMVAAATTGLAETPGGVRNFDYRYVWTRDASFCVSAFLNLGFRREAAEFLRFLHQSCDGGQAVRVMYAVDGPAPEEVAMNHLAGWRHSLPVRVGNDAREQKQFEIYGELLAALGLYVTTYGTDGLCPDLKADLPAYVTRLAEAAITNWRTPDQGIWELQGEPRHLLHTKVMCWVALDRAIELAPKIGLDLPTHWAIERDSIRADCLEFGWNEAVGAFVMEYGGRDLDMSTLRLCLMEFLPAADLRMRATLDRSQERLGTGDLYRRYRFDDGLPGDEGTFTACSFWVVSVLAMRGDVLQAESLFERLLERSNDVGLFAEQIDPHSGEQLGNFPQGFTHMALIHEAVRLCELNGKKGTATGP